MQEIDKKTFIKTLENVKAGLATKDLIVQTTSFIFRDNYVYTYNDELSACAETELDIEGAVEAEALLKLLHKIKDDVIEIWEEEDELRLKGKKFESGIKLDTEIKLPLDDVEIPEKFFKVSGDFVQSAKLACLMAGKAHSDPLLSCVHIENNKIESCDNERITICYFDSKIKCDVLVNAKNLLDIIKENIVGIAVVENWIHFKTDEEVVISSCKYDEDFVDLDEFIPEAEEDGKQITLPKEMKETLDRADVFSKDNVSRERLIHVSIKKKKLTISAQNDTGWHNEWNKVDYKGPELEFDINIEFLKDMLSMSNEISVVNDFLVFRDDNSIHLIQLDDSDD